MYSVERKAEIINLLEETGIVDVNVLAAKFNASKETIRRDLRELERDGALKRTHGGAVSTKQPASSATANEYPVAIRGIQRFSEKNEICKKAASFVQDGDTIFVDNSSTTIYLSKYIPVDIRVTFITNSIKFLLESINTPNHNHTYICLGGIFRDSNLSVHGTTTLKNAEEYYPNKAFLSCAGISPQNMFADSSIHEIDAKRLMIQRAQQVFMLADYTKFHKAGQIFLTDFHSVDYLITDHNTDLSSLGYLMQSRMQLLAAK